MRSRDRVNAQPFGKLSEVYNSLPEAFGSPVLWEDPDKRDPVPYKSYNGLLSRFDRILGCILGCALGDALASPAEGSSKGECEAYIEEHILTGDYAGVSIPNFASSQVTSVTQCMRLVALSFDEDGYFRGEEFADQISAYYFNPGLVYLDSDTRAAIEDYLRSGKPWHECGRPYPSCGNGAAARAAIFGVGATRYGGPSALSEMVRESCLATHLSEESILGAEIVAGLAREVSRWEGAPLEPRKLLTRTLLTLYPKYGSEVMFQDYLALIKDCSYEDPSVRDERVRGLAVSLEPGSQELSGHVRPSVLWAVYSFLSEPTDFTSTLAKAVSCGGDVGTIASIALALFGCYNGTALFPRDLLGQLHDRGDWTLRDYIALSRSLNHSLL